MGQIAIEITLREPVIASHDVATAARPESLPYIPGAMLWGVLASQLYKGSTPLDDILSHLHGGVVIGDAWPVAGGSVALPMPKSLHKSKDGGAWKDWSNEKRAVNHKQANYGQTGPSAGLGNDELNEVSVSRISSQRTAINPDQLVAAAGQLFGFQALAAGQKFIAILDGEFAKEAAENLKGDCILGRSRNAEYGRASIKRIDTPKLPDWGQDRAKYLWCLSDFAAHDEFYQPTERPNDFLGCEIDWSKSFVRHRRYSPYNAKWQTRQPERLVIARGSVIVLKGDVEAKLHRCGYWQEQGLGMIIASATPPLEMIKAWKATATGDSQGLRGSQTSTDLSIWLELRAERKLDRIEQRDEAQNAWTTWKVYYAGAESAQGERCGPTPTQWSALVGKDEKTLNEFLTKSAGNTGAAEKQAWQAIIKIVGAGDNRQSVTFASEVRKYLDDKGAEAVYRLAKSLREALIKERWFDGN